jgi:hypothetical protein
MSQKDRAKRQLKGKMPPTFYVQRKPLFVGDFQMSPSEWMALPNEFLLGMRKHLRNVMKPKRKKKKGKS